MLTVAEKRDLILVNEELQARRLARLVLEKPVPPIWMILIPVFFVFHAWRIKEYSQGLKDFADNYLQARRQALDRAFAIEGLGDAPESVVNELPAALPQEAISHYEEMMALLTEHYRSLLTVRGKSYEALLRGHYHTKSNFLLFCNRLSNTESALNKALLPRIEGEQQDLDDVVARMEKGSMELRRKEADTIFA